MNRREKIFGIVGIIVLLVTVLLYFMITKDRTSTSYMSFIILLLVEIILFSGLILIERQAEKLSQIILRAGCGGVLLIYSVIAVIVSLVFIATNKDAMRTLITVHIFLLSLATIVVVIFYTTSESVKKRDDKGLNAIARANEVADKLTLMWQNTNNEKHQRQLKKLSDDMRFIDTSISVPCDNDIDTTLSKLESALLKETDDKEATSLIEELLTLINKRKIQVKNSKGGQL